MTVSTQQALHIVVSGRVQGVGFRPFINRLANELQLNGWVRNISGQVEIWLEGEAQALKKFQKDLYEQKPPLAQPDPATCTQIQVQGFQSFSIKQSMKTGHADNHIPADFFVCQDCLDEMQNPTARRFRYPFINCTQCGPRYTIIDSLPYDRPNTSMLSFVLCRDCEQEYSNPLDRRYHAQPLACPVCGPGLKFVKPGAPALEGNEAALSACVKALSAGLIVAVKGVGGYHLLCDAANNKSVLRLRERKQRPDKPLALMLPWQGKDGLDQLRLYAEFSPQESTLLCSPLRPIVLLKKRAETGLSSALAAGLNELGVMLPYSPLHHLIATDFGSALVMTSANLSSEPVLITETEVESRLTHVADAFLHHNRPIRRPADDSVYRFISNKARPIRLARGMAPIERKLPKAIKKPVLAVGGDLKNSIALGFDNRVVISPYIADLGSLRSQQVFQQLVDELTRLYDVKPEIIITDKHPAYHSVRWAARQPLDVISVFHHHAHASAIYAEHTLKSTALVFTWDGTGLGEDGTIWGGEALLGKPGDWHRVASLRPFRLPGAEKVGREPWRSAISVCWELGLDWPDCQQDTVLLRQAWEKKINCPWSSSSGRLFDAAAALIGIVEQSSYEGHAAMQLEAISCHRVEPVSMNTTENDQGLLITDWGPLIHCLLDQSVNAEYKASVFHASLAELITEQAVLLREKYDVNQIGLSGGVFQNRLLTELATEKLIAQGFEVYSHEQLPSGDGNISFGQIIEARLQI